MNKRILIIDDEEHIRQMMRLTLEAAGYAIGEANDGPEGLKLFGEGSAWECAVLDQRMPGMDEMLVQIDEEALGYVERLTKRRLPPESSFWTGLARRLLGDYLWNEGDVPGARKLTLSQVSREELLIAGRWAE
jgi:CheY-like chemotaxis protein